MTHAAGHGSSIGVVLSSRSFYVNRYRLQPGDRYRGPVNMDKKGGATVPWGLFEADSISRACRDGHIVCFL